MTATRESVSSREADTSFCELNHTLLTAPGHIALGSLRDRQIQSKSSNRRCITVGVPYLRTVAAKCSRTNRQWSPPVSRRTEKGLSLFLDHVRKTRSWSQETLPVWILVNYIDVVRHPWPETSTTQQAVK